MAPTDLSFRKYSQGPQTHPVWELFTGSCPRAHPMSQHYQRHQKRRRCGRRLFLECLWQNARIRVQTKQTHSHGIVCPLRGAPRDAETPPARPKSSSKAAKGRSGAQVVPKIKNKKKTLEAPCLCGSSEPRWTKAVSQPKARPFCPPQSPWTSPLLVRMWGNVCVQGSPARVMGGPTYTGLTGLGQISLQELAAKQATRE